MRFKKKKKEKGDNLKKESRSGNAPIPKINHQKRLSGIGYPANGGLGRDLLELKARTKKRPEGLERTVCGEFK